MAGDVLVSILCLGGYVDISLMAVDLVFDLVNRVLEMNNGALRAFVNCFHFV